MNIQIILHQLLTLFLLMGAGFMLFRIGWMPPDFNRALTRLLIHVAMPLLIFDSVLKLEQRAPLSTVLLVLSAALSLYLILPLFGWLVSRALFVPKAQRGLYIYMTTFSNVGFMGFPLISALLSPEAVFYTALFNLIFNLSSFSYGILLIRSSQRDSSAEKRKSPYQPAAFTGDSIVPACNDMVFCRASLSSSCSGRCRISRWTYDASCHAPDRRLYRLHEI